MTTQIHTYLDAEADSFLSQFLMFLTFRLSIDADWLKLDRIRNKMALTLETIRMKFINTILPNLRTRPYKRLSKNEITEVKDAPITGQIQIILSQKYNFLLNQTRSTNQESHRIINKKSMTYSFRETSQNTAFT